MGVSPTFGLEVSGLPDNLMHRGGLTGHEDARIHEELEAKIASHLRVNRDDLDEWEMVNEEMEGREAAAPSPGMFRVWFSVSKGDGAGLEWSAIYVDVPESAWVDG